MACIRQHGMYQTAWLPARHTAYSTPCSCRSHMEIRKKVMFLLSLAGDCYDAEQEQVVAKMLKRER